MTLFCFMKKTSKEKRNGSLLKTTKFLKGQMPDEIWKKEIGIKPISDFFY